MPLRVVRCSAPERAAAYNHHPDRSGDAYLYQAPYWLMFDRGPIGVMHGSPCRYDQHVPLIFAGAGIPRGHVERLAHPSDVAPTLSAPPCLHKPAGAEGTALVEMLGRR